MSGTREPQRDGLREHIGYFAVGYAAALLFVVLALFPAGMLVRSGLESIRAEPSPTPDYVATLEPVIGTRAADLARSYIEGTQAARATEWSAHISELDRIYNPTPTAQAPDVP